MSGAHYQGGEGARELSRRAGARGGESAFRCQTRAFSLLAAGAEPKNCTGDSGCPNHKGCRHTAEVRVRRGPITRRARLWRHSGMRVLIFFSPVPFSCFWG